MDHWPRTRGPRRPLAPRYWLCGLAGPGAGRWVLPGGLHVPQPVPPLRRLQIQHCHAECVTDTQVCGARFCDPQGDSFAVTGYDLSEILRYSRV